MSASALGETLGETRDVGNPTRPPWGTSGVTSVTGGASAPPVPQAAASAARTVVEAFRTVGRDGADTNFETTGGLIVELRKGGTITTGTVRRAVLVLLDVDDEPYSVVRVQKGP